MAPEAGLAALDAAYLRLGLDPCASLEERAAIWHQAARAGRAEGLTPDEEQALRRILSQVKAARLDGGEVFEHLALRPRQQVKVMAAWRANICAWQQRPLEQQRSRSMQLLGKAAQNAFCCRRPRDAWKSHSRPWLEEMARCVAFAAEHVEELWRGDAISHHPLFEIVLSAPQTLAPLLAAALPCATAASLRRAAPLWNAYERAVVCVLRSRQGAACEAVAGRIFHRNWRLDGERGGRLRLASHTVRYAIPAGEVILRAWLEAPPATIRKLLSHHPGLCALRACLSTETTADYLPALLRRQQEVATRLQLLAQDDPALRALLCPASGRKLGRRVAEMMSSALSAAPRPQGAAAPRVEHVLLARAEGQLEELPERESTPPPGAERERCRGRPEDVRALDGASLCDADGTQPVAGASASSSGEPVALAPVYAVLTQPGYWVAVPAAGAPQQVCWAWWAPCPARGAAC
jgi:hypothetical protein